MNITPEDHPGTMPVAGHAVPPAPVSTHTVSAIYPDHLAAESTRNRLLAVGIANADISILNESSQLFVEEGSDEVLKDMLVDGAIGTAIGAGAGALGTVMLWASSVTLFVASPVVAPLVMMGWFASIGGLAGAAAGAAATDTPGGEVSRKEGVFSELVRDAIKSGNVVLMVRTHSDSERARAKALIGDSLLGRTTPVSVT